MDQIIKIVFACNGFVFGGYVRDMLYGCSPKDIDCYIPPDQHNAFWMALLNRFKSFTVERVDSYGRLVGDAPFFSHQMFLQRLVVVLFDLRKGMPEHVHVDVVDSPNPDLVPDFDVNMLKMDRNGIGVMNNRVNILTVLANIRSKQAAMFPTCSSYRRRKMENRGWKVL
jgi:hypothetical protein